MWHHDRDPLTFSRARTTSAITRRALLAGATRLAVTPSASRARRLDRVVFGTNWRAQGEHGGFYHAVATGIIAARDSDVTIRQGGPQINSAQLLAAGRLDFNMGASLFGALNYVASGVPIITVAAGLPERSADLHGPSRPGQRLARSVRAAHHDLGGAVSTYWQFLKQRFGYTDARSAPIPSNSPLSSPTRRSAGLILNERSLSRPSRRASEPVVLLLADGGYTSYTTTIETRSQVVRRQAGSRAAASSMPPSKAGTATWTATGTRQRSHQARQSQR